MRKIALIALSSGIIILGGCAAVKTGVAPLSLMLPAARLAQQTAGGTWSVLFNTSGLLSRFQALGLCAWYLAVGLLGLIVYPLVRLAFPGLSDRGYPLARMTGLLLLALVTWLAGSFGVPFTRTTITVVLACLVLTGLVFAYLQRTSLGQEWRTRRSYFLSVEAVMLLFFAIDLGIRLGNPDLWHPAYGGEKPMDFSFFNAVLKSTTFPPYDPWFAGGYMNYYYYGYVVVGVLVKWLGIVPSVAYNLILPTLFSLLALGAFSAGWNLSVGHTIGLPPSEMNPQAENPVRGTARLTWPSRPFRVGVAVAVCMVILGNLGTVRMIWQGFQLLEVPQETMDKGGVVDHWVWSAEGLVKYLGGARLPFSAGDWYWKPSRAIIPEAGNEITEFPFFSFLYADLHASTMALPISALAVGWALSVFLGKGRWGEPDGRLRWTSHGLGLLVGAVVIGAMRPVNTWDVYTYLPLGAVALGVSAWQGSSGKGISFFRRGLGILVDVTLLAGLSILLYQPFASWFGQAFSQVDLWHGNHTVIWSYLVHWGFFLFILFTWFIWESVNWMAATPLSALAKLRHYLWLLATLTLLLVGGIFALTALDGVQIAWLPLILGAWAALLIFRPGMPDSKRAALFLAGTALILTLVVEVIVLHGDINRQNTVFKLYLQAWTLFAISGAAALGWLVSNLSRWLPKWQVVWSGGLAVIVSGAALCTVMMAVNKINDRMAPAAPLSLDGMAYMQYATYFDGIPDSNTGLNMDLSEDYHAIRWMQEQVSGSPVIVEANIPIYHWGSRFTIYTGLPGVLGWDWHEIQQRGLLPSTVVTDRVTEIRDFYQTTDLEQARAFLKKYNVAYIIVGQYEQVWYPGPGLNKFPQMAGILWDQVYKDQGTVIYQAKSP